MTLDGVPMTDPFFGYVPLSALSPDRLRQITVTRGASSGPFGAGALAGSIDVLFLGLGADIAIPPRALIATLEDAGVMTEPMSTPSAARSYNVTLSEGRRVACALIPL